MSESSYAELISLSSPLAAYLEEAGRRERACRRDLEGRVVVGELAVLVRK